MSEELEGRLQRLQAVETDLEEMGFLLFHSSPLRDNFYSFEEQPSDPRVARLAVEFAAARGGQTLPVSSYDIERAQEAITGTSNLVRSQADQLKRYREALALHNCGDPECLCITGTRLREINQ